MFLRSPWVSSACISLLLAASEIFVLGGTGLLGHSSRLTASSRSAQPFAPQALVVRGFRARRRFRRLRLLPAARATPRLVRPETGKSSSFPLRPGDQAQQVSLISVIHGRACLVLLLDSEYFETSKAQARGCTVSAHVA